MSKYKTCALEGWNVLLCDRAEAGVDPAVAAEDCRSAIHNWTIRWLTGDSPFTPAIAINGETWATPAEAIAAWKRALDYWENQGDK